MSKDEECDGDGIPNSMLSGVAMLNVIFNIQAEASWLTGNVCQMLYNIC